MSYSPSDLTAHTLGEPLPPEIRRELETALATDPAAQAEAEATQELEDQLSRAFAAELSLPVPSARVRPPRRNSGSTWLYASLGAAAVLTLSALVFPALRPAPVTVSATPSVEELRSRLAKSEVPRPETVRVGELVAYFSTPAPAGSRPTMELASAPWNPRHRLLRLSGPSAQAFDVSLAPGQVESFRVLTSEDLSSGSNLVLPEGVTLCEIVPSASSDSGQVLLNLKGRHSSETFTVANTPVEFAQSSPEMRLTTAVTAYGLLLKNSSKAPLSLPSIRDVAAGLPTQGSLRQKEFSRMLEASRLLVR